MGGASVYFALVVLTLVSGTAGPLRIDSGHPSDRAETRADSADGSGEAVDLHEDPSSLSETALIAEGENKADGELRSAGSVMRSAGQAVPVLTQTGAEERSLRRHTQPATPDSDFSEAGN